MTTSTRLRPRPVPSAAQDCTQCPIRTRAVCSNCGPSELAVLNEIKFYKTFSPGQEIVAAGETTNAIGSVVEGVVSLSKTLADGRRQMVGLIFPSDFLGRPNAPTAPYDAVAVSEVTMCLFQRTQFERLMRETPALEHRLLEMMLDELDAARDWMLLLGRKTAQEKLATFLTILARRAAATAGAGGPGDGIRIALPLTREAIADYLGLTIETVSRQISALKKAGVIRLEDTRHVTIVDFAGLLDAAAEDADGGMIA